MDDDPHSVGLITDADNTSRIAVKAASMNAFADILSRLLHVPVVNATGVEGRYDVSLPISKDESAVPGTTGDVGTASPGISEINEASISAALKTLGLQLRPAKVTLVRLTVTSAVQTPDPN